MLRPQLKIGLKVKLVIFESQLKASIVRDFDPQFPHEQTAGFNKFN